ncbi:MAG TPA: hypothetical protein VF193_00290 [Steroidobacter sp.]|jgi:hypothetical protein
MEYRFTSTTLLMMGGLLIWGADFLIVYTFAAIACARQFADLELAGLGIVPAFTVAVSAIACVASASIGRAALRRLRAGNPEQPRSFIDFLALAVSVLAIIAIVWNALPALLIEAC